MNQPSDTTEALTVPGDAVFAQAKENIESGRVLLLTVSGWLASGKDTVAPAVLDRLGYTNAVHLSYADALRTEVDGIIDDLREWFFAARSGSLTQRHRMRLAGRIADKYDIPVQQAFDYYCTQLLDQVRMNLRVHSRSRTRVVRRALQAHGTEVRRTQNEDYWVNRAMASAIRELAAGNSVFFTDGRFPNEMQAPRALGGTAVRLDITRETQMARLLARDGIGRPSDDVLFHTSEIALNDYAFDVRVDNNGTLEQALTQVLARLGDRAYKAVA